IASSLYSVVSLLTGVQPKEIQQFLRRLYGFLHHQDRCEARVYPLSSLPVPSCHRLCYVECHGPRWLWDTLATTNTFLESGLVVVGQLNGPQGLPIGPP
uniref:Uncharacterized protein n=1 Tax=Maylandia zebra TaxID=106582 RepID=A0A3P9DFW1_9CICH